jgi:hypothetical protein
MREFKHPIFAGSVPPIYKAHVKKLKRIVDQALVVQSGLQQPPRSESEKAAKQDREERLRWHKALEDMRADIDTALGGNSAEVLKLVRQLLLRGCDATTCGIRYEACNGTTVKKLKKLLGIK